MNLRRCLVPFLISSMACFAAPAVARFSIPGACPGIRTDAELLNGSGEYVLMVTFYSSIPTNAQIDEVDRSYLAKTTKRINDRDIMVTPWFRARGSNDPNDDQELHPYGGLVKRASGFVAHQVLIYRASSHKIEIY